MSAPSEIITCHGCGRTVTAFCGRYKRHAVTPNGDDICRMTGQHTPPSGHSDRDYIKRAHLIGDLARQVQDADPALVWDYLTALPATEVQTLLQLALAAVPVDKPIQDVWAWVCDLPKAKAVAM